MKKNNIYKFLYVISIFLIVGFIITIVTDYFKYDKISNSAPFYVFIVARIIEFIIPSIIFFVIAIILKKQSKSLIYR